MIAIALLRRIYRWTISLYPRAFRLNFADEMLDVFEQAVADAARQGIWSALAVCFREFADLPMNVLFAQVHQKGKTMNPSHRDETQELQTARWIARISSLALTVFYGFIILKTDQPALFIVIVLAMSVSLALAWKWEKIGGLVTVVLALICAVVVGLNAMLSVPALSFPINILWGLGCILTVLIVWVLPYPLLGWLFISIARRTNKVAQRLPQNHLSPAG